MLFSSVNHLFRLGPSIPWRTVSHNQRVIPHEWIEHFDDHQSRFDMFLPRHTMTLICLVINQHNWQTGDF